MEEPTLFSFSPVSPIFCKIHRRPARLRLQLLQSLLRLHDLPLQGIILAQKSPLASASLACCPASFKAQLFLRFANRLRQACASAPSACIPKVQLQQLVHILLPLRIPDFLFTFDKAVDGLCSIPTNFNCNPLVLDATLPPAFPTKKSPYRLPK